MTKQSITKFAKTVLEVGVNLQKDQILMISTPMHKQASETAFEMTKLAYEMGARRVIIDWKNSELAKIRYEHESVESLTEIFEYEAMSKLELIDKGICRVAIYSEDPEVFASCDTEKMAAYNKAFSTKLKPFSTAQMTNKIRWCVACVPEDKWALKIFPNDTAEDACEKLWDMIIKTMLLDKADPVIAWKEKCATMHKRCDFLNSKNFKTMHYKNALGTDLHVDMMSDSIWLAADEKDQGGTNFMANLPTEEIFSAPHKLGTNGTLYSALPLCFNGNIIDKFCLTFENGRIVNYTAEVGYDYLKNIIETDEGSHFLGEIAIVQHDSPISNLKTLFYNTLFDENASCHFAIGQGYASCTASGLLLKQDDLIAHGLNDSLMHEDFMVGTSDLSIIGETHDGEMINILVDGNFVI